MKGTPDQTGLGLPLCPSVSCSESPKYTADSQSVLRTSPDPGVGWGPPPPARSPTCHGEAGPIALPGLPAVLVLGDAAVGGQGVLLLHVGDVQPAVESNKKPVFWRHNQDIVCYSPGWAHCQKQLGLAAGPLPG